MSLPKNFSIPAADNQTVQIPSVGFGTWAAKGGQGWCKIAVLAALKAGYRHLDCAWYYGVDAEIGEAIRESGIPRSEIFVTSKIWQNFYAPEDVELGADKILKGMSLDYVDLLLAHWPCAFQSLGREALEQAQFTGPGDDATFEARGIAAENGVELIDWQHTTENLCRLGGKKGSFVPTLKAMQDLVRKGKARTIGVSNFSIGDIKDLLPHCKEIPISCNQVECHPWLAQRPLIDFCRDNDIIVSCYSPFAGQIKSGETLIKDPTVQKLAEKNGLDVGQLLQSWAVQRGTIPLGKSQTESRIKSNLDVKRLSNEDMKAIDALEIPDEKGRTIDFTDEWGVKLYQSS